MWRFWVTATQVIALTTGLYAADDQLITSRALGVEEFLLGNGMKFLLVPRPEINTVAAGWVVKAGSADDRTGESGLSHLFEHLLFKGSRTIGSQDARREQALLDRQDQVRTEIMELQRGAAVASERKAQKLDRRIARLEAEFERLQEEATSLAFLGQFSFFYSELGATGLNANTYPDMTVYFVNIPTNRLEGWFWMESDRLLQPVFREFYKEIEIVHEERRMRIDSTPTGELDEEVRRVFWGSHPYAIGPQGRQEEVDRLTRPMARDFFDRHYRPENITAALVGGFDPQQVKNWARTYFGRLQSAQMPADRNPSTPHHPPEPRESRIESICECSPQAQVHYSGVAFGHPDAYAIDVLAGVLNGRTGRLYRSLVLDQEIAFSAYVRHRARKRAGQFSFFAETKGDVLPAALVTAWDREVARLQQRTAGDEEILRAVNRMSADAFRSLKEPAALMSQLLYYEGLGDWRHVSDWTRGIRSIRAADVQRVANRYLRPQARTIAVYYREESSTGSNRLGSPRPRNGG